MRDVHILWRFGAYNPSGLHIRDEEAVSVRVPPDAADHTARCTQQGSEL